MSPFEWLLCGHLVGDWLLQSDYEAVTKTNRWPANVTHAAKWTLSVATAAWIVGWRGETRFLVWLLAMGIVHALVDRRWPTLWVIWVKERIPLANPLESRDTPLFLVFCVDQVLHILQIAVLSVILTAGGNPA